MPEEFQTPPDITAMSFEKALEELEQLTAKLENGGLPLAEMIALFERGKQLMKHCRSHLNTLERRITLLTADDGKDGKWQDFEPDTSRQTPPQDDGDLPF